MRHYFETILQNDEIRLSQVDSAQLTDTLTMTRNPQYLSTGRTSYYVLKAPLRLSNGLLYHSLKIKGAGFGVMSTQRFSPPSTHQAFTRPAPHFGFDVQGRATRDYSEDAPFGGITVSKALNEYKVALGLVSAGVSCIYPYMVVRYPELKFRGESIGAVVSLNVDAIPHRLLQLLWDEKHTPIAARKYYRLIAAKLRVAGDMQDTQIRSRLAQKIALFYGREVRKFSDAGFYIHSGGWSNIQYDSQSNNVSLTDLDSTRMLQSVSERLKALHALRDFVSNLYRLLISLYHPNAVSLYTREGLVRDNLLFHLMRGYFYDVSESLLLDISLDLWNFYFVTCFDRIKAIEHIMDTIPEEEHVLYELPMMPFYEFALQKLYPYMLQTNSRTITATTLSAYPGSILTH